MTYSAKRLSKQIRLGLGMAILAVLLFGSLGCIAYYGLLAILANGAMQPFMVSLLVFAVTYVIGPKFIATLISIGMKKEVA